MRPPPDFLVLSGKKGVLGARTRDKTAAGKKSGLNPPFAHAAAKKAAFGDCRITE